MFLNKVIFSLVFFALIVTIKSDTPANCTYEDIRGTWVFHEGSRMNDKTVNCSAKIEIKSAFKFELNFPNIATDEDGNVGVWTIIYNQGFEVTINNRKYFAFSLYSQDGDNVTSYCMHTSWGWAHETGVNPRDWSCYVGAKLNTKSEEKPKYHKINKYKHKKLESLLENRMYKTNFDFIEEINSKQSSWKATSYDFLNDMKMSDLIKLAGGKKSKIFEKPTPSPVDELTFELASEMPESFDWRNVSGENYISPIRNQGNCGSCYAFASMGMNEARLRIKTANKQQNIFSPQDIVECSEYSQGCEGGFPYLIAGKYAEDFGLTSEDDNPYSGKDGQCSTNSKSAKMYSTNYHYVGGFYGGCNEALMRIELVKNGPLAIAFQVYDDFMAYRSGIYHHTFVKDKKNFEFNPFELTNHAVLLVGYGIDNTLGEMYWIVKNSWGTEWGEDGFFRILRGSDECSIESLAVGADIVV